MRELSTVADGPDAGSPGVTIAVVIPFFQREPGVLSRALRSVAAQALGARDKVVVLIVDDESPVPPEAEVAGVEAPASVTFTVVKRRNGGPAAARNTGIDAAPPATDFIAFLDSDDLWTPDHLRDALQTLGADCDFYFCDHLRLDRGVPHFQALCAERGVAVLPRSGSLSQEEVARFHAGPLPGSFVFADGEQIRTFVQHYLAQTSTIVYRASRFPALRFDESFRVAGEDYLFTMQLASAARRVCFSLAAHVRRGAGVNIYETALGWDHPSNLQHIFENYRCALRARAILKPSGETAALMDRLVDVRRETFAYLLMRRAIRHRRLQSATLLAAFRADPTLLRALPAILARLVIFRARGGSIEKRLGIAASPTLQAE